MVTKKTDGTGPDEPQPQKPTGPLSQEAIKAAAFARLQAALQAAANDPTKTEELKTAMQEAINAGIDIAPAIETHESPDTIIVNSRASNRKIRRNHQRPFIWLQSPGLLIGGVQTKWLIQDNAKARKVKIKNGQVERVRTARNAAGTKIYIYATHGTDSDGFDVEEEDSATIINIADWMFEQELAPAPGLRQKFDLVEATELIQGLPALCIDLTKARKTTTFKFSHTSKKKEKPAPDGTTEKKVDPGTQGPEASAADTAPENQ